MTKEYNPKTEIEFTHFQKPTGKREVIVMTSIRPAAAQYINEHDIKVSTEDGMNGSFVVYFDDGTLLDDDVTPDEIIIIANTGKLCEDTMDEGVELLKKRAA